LSEAVAVTVTVPDTVAPLAGAVTDVPGGVVSPPDGVVTSVDREEAIVGVPEDRVIRTDFGREVILDLSSAEQEYASLIYPVSQVFDWDKWQDGFDEHWSGDQKQTP
jgi:hypothetical protein